MQRDETRVLDVLERAAGLHAADTDVLVVKELHRRADALTALLLHQKCGDARVHTAAHRNEYLIHISSHHAARFGAGNVPCEKRCRVYRFALFCRVLIK